MTSLFFVIIRTGHGTMARIFHKKKLYICDPYNTTYTKDKLNPPSIAKIACLFLCVL